MNNNEFLFTPTGTQTREIEVPYFEDARADFAPYYNPYQAHTIQKCQNAVMHELAKLGAGSIFFQDGKFGTGSKPRHGYQIWFQYGNAQGVIRVAGLPMRSETAHRVEGVKMQALLNVRDWLKAAVTSRVFSPGSDVLIPFLLVDGKRTISEVIVESGRLPQLAAPEWDGYR
jgi:hypothetical protein